MKSLKISLVILLLIGISACSGSPKTEQTLVTDPGPNPRFLENIPSDTPFVFASLEPLPGNVIIEKFKGIGSLYDQYLDTLEKDLNSEYVDADFKTMIRILGEFKGKFSKEGLESLGFSITPRGAVYGIGLLPVLRFEVKDGEKIKALINRIELSSGNSSTLVKRGEAEHREYRVEDVIIPVKIEANEVTFGITPPEASDLYLSLMLGEVIPSPNLGDTKALDEMALKFGFSKIGVGYIDVEAVTRSLLGTAGGLSQKIASAIDASTAMDKICQDEIMGIAKRFSRIVGGYDEMSADRVKARVGILLGDDLGSQLMAVKMSIPAGNTDYIQNAPLSAGIGVNVGKLVDLVRTNLGKIRDQPFQCADLAQMNQDTMSLGSASAMLPPAATQIQGFVLALQSVTWDAPSANAQVPQAPNGAIDENPNADTSPMQVEGVALLASADAIALMDAAKLFVPVLTQVTLVPNGEIQAIPAIAGTESFQPLFGVMNPKMIGLGIGESARNELPALAKSSGDESPMVRVRYNFAELANIILGPNPEPNPELDAYINLLGTGTSEMSVDPTKDGLFLTVIQNLN